MAHSVHNAVGQCVGRHRLKMLVKSRAHRFGTCSRNLRKAHTRKLVTRNRRTAKHSRVRSSGRMKWCSAHNLRGGCRAPLPRMVQLLLCDCGVHRAPDIRTQRINGLSPSPLPSAEQFNNNLEDTCWLTATSTHFCWTYNTRGTQCLCANRLALRLSHLTTEHFFR